MKQKYNRILYFFEQRVTSEGIWNQMIRRLKYLCISGCVFRGIEHFLVMFPSALLIASLTNTSYGEPIFNLSSILLSVGIGTIIFIFLTKGNVPFFLGPSFSYIGFTSYYVASISCVEDIQNIRSTILWGYLLSGILLACLSFLYRFEAIKRAIEFLFPNVVMGPAISLIGLELANTAINDAGLTSSDYKVKILSTITLIIIIIASLTKRKLFKNASVFIGVLCGCIIAHFMGMFSFDIPSNGKLFTFPSFYTKSFTILPNNAVNLFISIIPSTIVLFTEIISRTTVLHGMQKRDNIIDNTLMSRSLKMHSIANLFSTIVSSLPITFYAENLAIMNLNNASISVKGSKIQDEDSIVQNFYDPYSIYPYIIASITSILVACVGLLQDFFVAIPKAVLGAMELFIFTLVASPGIQILVDSKVDYKKISNQIITASILLAGVSSLIIEYKTIYLRGMSLGLTIGVFLNLLTKGLSHLGLLNEDLTLMDILENCIECYNSKIYMYVRENILFSDKEISYPKYELYEKIHKQDIYDMLQFSKIIELRGKNNRKKIIIKQTYDQIRIIVTYPINLQKKYCNDYNFVIPIDEQGHVQIIINSSISIYKLRNLLKDSI